MDPLRSLNIKDLRLWRAWWLVPSFSTAKIEPHYLWITMEAEISEPVE
jgi:hypothetical protein